MKSLKYILAMAAMSLFTVSCVEEYQYEKGEADVNGCYGVYFPAQEATGDHTYDPSMPTEMAFTVARTNSEGAITVPIEFSASHDGIFNVPAAVFADGQSETTINVTFPNSENGVKYSLSLGITDPQYASKYQDGATHVDFSVLRVEWKDFLNPQTNKPAVVTFNQGWWGEVHKAALKYYEVNGIRTCVATCTETDADGNPIGIWGDTQGITFNFTWNTNLYNPDGYQVIDVTRQYFGFDYADWTSKPEAEASNPVYFYDWFHFLTTDGGYVGGWPDWASFLERNPGAYDQSYYDGNGGFYFNLKYQVPALGGGFTPDVFDVVAIADGFVRVDYSLSVAADYTVEGEVPVTFELGADIAKINYAVAAGKLGPAAIEELTAAVAAGKAENMQVITEDQMFADEEGKYASIVVTCPATGEYTLVAAGLDAEGKAQASTSVVFDYVAADDATYDVEFEVFVEDTPARYEAEDLTKLNSFSYVIYGGNEVTDVHVGVYPVATVEKYGVDVVINDVRNAANALDADAVAAVNSTAGYSNIVSGLDDGTAYALVVWAANGLQTKYTIVTYTTEANPEVFKSLGNATYTDDYIAGLFDVDPVTYEVAIEESVDNPGKYRLVNAYGENFPYNETGDWDDSKDYYIVINAQDPECVYIELSPMGLNWGYDMSAYSYAAYMLDNGKTVEEVKAAGLFGTLVDGVITFPTKTLLCVLDGSIYYANTNGAFKVVLPGAQTGAETTSVAAARPSSVSAKAAFETSMSVGRSTGISVEHAARTVACDVKASNVIVKKADRHSAIETMSSVSLN